MSRATASVSSKRRRRPTTTVATATSIEVLENRLLMTRVQGIDVSHWQGTINWSSVASAGKQFAFQKATESNNYVDPTMTTNLSGGTGAGLLMGVYHFARPTQNDAVTQANYFVDNAGQYMTGGFLHPVLDLEDGSSLGKTALSQWVNTFCNTVMSRTGVDPVIYCNTNYAANYVDSTVAAHDLWIANWSTSYGDPLTTGSPPDGVWGSGNWDYWQYSSTGTVSGVSGNVDLDVYNGDYAALQANMVIGATPPSPGTITGATFEDTNGNGVLDAGEPATVGRTVYVDANNNSVLDSGEPSAVTDATGHYSISANPGTYTVRQILPGGWYQSVPANNAGRTATVTSGGTTTLFAFGSARYGSIGGRVFNDANSNGLLDTGENGLSGWTVYIDTNNNGKLDSGERSATTASDGSWLFDNLTADNYTIRVVQKNKHYKLTTPSTGSYSHTLFSGTSITDDLFGER
jgi:GH25 family lysozyme M1 (1,4-beta-N-acetylmuramidase)